MQHIVTTTLTLIGVLVHAGVGCCAHHVHCSQTDESPVEVASVEPASQHLCSCAHHGHCAKTESPKPSGRDVQSDSAPCPCGESCDDCADHCFWITNSRVELPEQQQWILTALPDDANGQSPTSTVGPVDTEPAPLHGLAGPLRALAQVWLL